MFFFSLTAITSMLPIVLFPLLGILVSVTICMMQLVNGNIAISDDFLNVSHFIALQQETDKTCMMYMKDTMLMFIGGLVIALAVQHCNLHQRMALKVISIIGCSQRKYVN